MRMNGMGAVVTAPDGVSQALSIDDWFSQFVVAPAIMAQPGQLGYTTDRATMIASWTNLINGMCQQWPWRCVGINISSMIAAGADAVLAGRQAGVPVDGGGTYYPGANISCSPGYVLANGQCVSGPCPTGYTPYNGVDSSGGCRQNALTYVAPTPTVVSPMPPINVLAPPAPQQAPTLQQIAGGQTVSGGMLSNSLPDLSGATSWVEANWPLLAAGMAALVILPMVLGGRR